MYATLTKKSPAPKQPPFALPALAAVVRALLLARKDRRVPPGAVVLGIQLLRKSGPAPETLVREALRLAGRAVNLRLSRRLLDQCLGALEESGAVVCEGKVYELSPAVRSAPRRSAAPNGRDDYREFVALSGRRHYYSRRCAADLLALDALLGRDSVGQSDAIIAFEALGLDWSPKAVGETSSAMRFESGPEFYREHWGRFDDPFAAFDSLEAFVADRLSRGEDEAA